MIEAVVGVALRAILASVLLGGVLAALVLVATRTLSLTAATRHALWTSALVATALMPLAGVGVSLARATAAAAPAPSLPATEFASDVTSSPAGADMHTFVIVDGPSAQPGATAFAFATWTPRVSRALALGVVGVWALGALGGLIGLAASVARVRGLKRRSSPLDGTLADELPWLTEVGPGREIYLRLSYETETPVAIGFRRPVILIPTELATADGLAAIESLILHEHAHLRRNDDWTNLLQRAIERVFWFNPIVWFLGRRIALEREIASDDAVVEKTGEAHAYATSLWKLVREMRMPEHAVVAPGALLTRKQITVRIEQLLDKKRARLHRSPVAALGVALAGVLSIAFVATSAPAVELPAEPVLAAAPPAAAVPAPQPAQSRARITAAHAKLPAKQVLTSKLPPGSVWKTVRNSVRTTNVRTVRDVQSNAVRTQLQYLREQLAAAKKNATVMHEKTIRVVERTPQTGAWHEFTPLPPAPAALTPLVPLPAMPAAPAPPPQPVVKLQAATAAASAIAAHARDMAQVKYDADVERTIKVAMATIPHELGFEVNGTRVRVNGNLVRRSRFDGMKLTREMVAACTACSFRNADARGLDLHDLKLNADNFNDADMRGANLAGAKLAGVSLAHANLGNADLRGAQLTGVELRDANFEGAQLDGIRLTGVSVRYLHLRGAALRSIVANCAGCEFGGVDLHGQDLHGLTVTGVDFNHADLHDANLSGVHFVSVDLSHANLSGADLTNAHLETCDLDGADMRNARTAGMTTHGSGLDG
ncbi:MAG TPA: M56 family metallopeptidase [Candidatus Elarobacter sp.]|jgi:uncharacterized protein YjbI with pentapeptide repeats/beta-lactamase regulating signal transducer with metallopeptidase domain